MIIKILFTNLTYMNPNNPGNPSGRIQSVDILRGAIMVLMAIDHVRVYSGSGTNLLLLPLYLPNSNGVLPYSI